MSTNSMMKPAIVGGLVVAGDKFFLNEPDLTKSLYFGGAVAVGVYSAGAVTSMLPSVFPSGAYVDGKTLELRLAEIGLSAGAGYAINRFVLKNDVKYSQLYPKLALIAGADFIGEYISDYLENRPLSFLK